MSVRQSKLGNPKSFCSYWFPSQLRQAPTINQQMGVKRHHLIKSINKIPTLKMQSELQLQYISLISGRLLRL